MKVTLKNVKTFTGRQGVGLNATVFVNGEKCFFYTDEANGGCSYHEPIFQKDLYEKLLAHIKDLPMRKYSGIKGHENEEYKPDIDSIINDALADHKFEIFKKKALKKTDVSLVFVSRKHQLLEIKFGSGVPISFIAERAPYKLKGAIEKAKIQHPEFILINKNIPAELLN